MEEIQIKYKIAIHKGSKKGFTIDFTTNLDDLELDSLSSLLIEAGHLQSWSNNHEFHIVSREFKILIPKFYT